MAIEPARSVWNLSAAPLRQGEEVVAVGGDLEPGTLLEAYRHGLFPMGLGQNGARPMGWWCPVSRGVLLPGQLRVSRSLRRACRRFDVTIDTAFDRVVSACADTARPGRWITREIAEAYGRLHRLGWGHSVEVWNGPELVGGLYGVAIGGLFAGESMFRRATDASKVALVALEEICFGDDAQDRIIDVQWQTPHLESLGITELPRMDYVSRLASALARPLPHVFTDMAT